MGDIRQSRSVVVIEVRLRYGQRKERAQLSCRNGGSVVTRRNNGQDRPRILASRSCTDAPLRPHDDSSRLGGRTTVGSFDSASARASTRYVKRYYCCTLPVRTGKQHSYVSQQCIGHTLMAAGKLRGRGVQWRGQPMCSFQASKKRLCTTASIARPSEPLLPPLPVSPRSPSCRPF